MDDQTLKHLAEIGDEALPADDGGDVILNLKGISMTPIIYRQAFRKTFQGILQKDSIPEDARETLTKMALAMMNVEELLGTLFAGFYRAETRGSKSNTCM